MNLYLDILKSNGETIGAIVRDQNSPSAHPCGEAIAAFVPKADEPAENAVARARRFIHAERVHEAAEAEVRG